MTALLGIAVVAIVVVAGVVIVNNNNKDSDDKYVAGASHLQIRGNANDDTTIDAKDMEILDKIISQEYKAEDYPLADVNGNGNVDDTDKQLLQDLIDRKAGTKVYVVCLNRDGNTTFQEITYPLRNVVTYGTNAQLPTLYANGGQYVAGYFKSSYTVAEGSISDAARDLKGDARSIPTTAWANFTKLDSDLETGVGALIVDYSGISAITDSYAEDITDGKIPFLVFSSADASAEVTTVLTLGFLFGGECEKMGLDYATKSWEVMNKIGKEVSSISDDKKTTFIACTMYIYICQNDSTFATSAIAAGGMPYYKTNSSFAEAYKGANSVKMASVEALSNYKDIGAIINNRSMDWGLDPSEVKAMIIGSWDHDNAGISSTQYFKGFDNKLAYIDNIMPGAVKVAYMAHALYGDKFSIDYANDVLLQFINSGTLPLKGQTLNTIVPYIDKGIYDKAVSSSTVNVGDDAVNMAYSLQTNYSGKYKTGAAEATLSFAPGSNADKATLAVANGNADPDYNKNTIAVTKSGDAKTAYTVRYSEYAAFDGYTSATLSSDFYGAYACYKNDAGTGTAYLTAYVENVLVECYLYTSEDIAVSDLQTLLTALFTAVTNPVNYDGPAIPEGESSGAKLMAETLAANAAWSVSSSVDATSASAVAVFATKNGMGNDTTCDVQILSDYGSVSTYATLSAAVDAHSTEAVAKGNGSYVAYAESIDGVQLHAIYGHIAEKKYSYVYFVMRCGDLIVDCSDAKVSIYNATEANLEADTLAFFTQIANALKA